jgi:hypothetical protein
MSLDINNHSGQENGQNSSEHVSINVHSDGKGTVVVIDLGEHTRSNNPHPKPDPGIVLHYKIKVAGNFYTVPQSHMTGAQILALAGVTPKTHQLNQQRRIHSKIEVRPVKPEQVIDFTEPGIEQFMLLALDNTEGENRHYTIMVDGKPYTVTESSMTGEQILALVGTTSRKHQLNIQRRVVGRIDTKPVKADQVVDFAEPGIEKFTLLPLDNTEGEEVNELPLRRQFLLLPADQEFLDATGYRWETVLEGPQQQWVLIHDVPVPDGYSAVTTCMAIHMSTGYPRTQLDMVYVFPGLQRRDQQAIGALVPQVIDGKQFQRWSRHRTAANPWRPGIDDLSTHFQQARVWFSQEFDKYPRTDAVLA